MHVKLLQTVENDIARLDRHHLVRARLLLQSAYGSMDSRLDERGHMPPERVAALEAERMRIGRAVNKIGGRIQMLGVQGKPG